MWYSKHLHTLHSPVLDIHHSTYALKAEYAFVGTEGECTTTLVSREVVASVAYKSTPEACQGP